MGENDEARTGIDGGEPADPHEVRRLIRTAVYDTGGETVEGSFVDHWVSNAALAIDDLEAIFSRHGFSDADAALIRAAMREPNAPPDAVVGLVSGLGRWTRPLVEAMLDDPWPGARVVAVGAGGNLLDPARWLRLLADPHPAVRRAAVSTLSQHRRKVPAAQIHLRRALDDDDAQVRLAAAGAVEFYRDAAGGEALIRRLGVEADRQVSKAILSHIATKTRTEGVHVDSETLAERIGAPVKALLLRELNNEDAEIRALIASALERLHSADVATAMLERLLVEPARKVRATLVLFNGYPAIADRALPVLASLLAADPDPTIRTRVAWLMESFGAAAVPLLIAALDDPGARRAAAMSLGHVGDAAALPALLRELANPANRDMRREIETALRDVTIRASYSKPRPPSPEVAARLQRRIDALQPETLGDWLIRLCKEELNALPLHGNLIYLWAIRPDGTVLCLDHEAFGHPVEPETDPLVTFALVVQGARHYPELQELVPPPPVGVQPCDACYGTGRPLEGEAANTDCFRCSGLGWVMARPPTTSRPGQ